MRRRFLHLIGFASRVRRLLFAGLCVLGVAAIPPAVAHEGHVHADAAALPQDYEPRFEARSDAVEVTGILAADTLWLFVAHYPDNSPWAGLEVALENGADSVPARAEAPGVYRVAAGALARSGKHGVVLSLRGEGLDELLNGELVVAPVAAPAVFSARWMFTWRWILIAAAALVIFAVLLLLLRRRTRSYRLLRLP